MSNFLAIKIRSEVSGFLHHGSSLLNREWNSFLLHKGVTKGEFNIVQTNTVLSTSLSTSALHGFHSKQHQHLLETELNVLLMWAVESSHIRFILLFHVRIQLNNESQQAFCFRKVFPINTNRLLIFLKLYWIHNLVIMNDCCFLSQLSVVENLCQNPANWIVQIGEQVAAGRDAGVLAGSKLRVSTHWQQGQLAEPWAAPAGARPADVLKWFFPFALCSLEHIQTPCPVPPIPSPRASTGKAPIALGEFSVGPLQWPWLEHPALEERLRHQESFCLEMRWLWGWSTSGPTVPTRM